VAATPLGGITFESIQADSPASQAGLVVGDTIVSIDGATFDFFAGPEPVIADLRAHAGETAALGIKHADGSTTDISVTLRPAAELSETKGALGIAGLRFTFTGSYMQQDPLTALRLGAERDRLGVPPHHRGLGQLVSSIVLLTSDGGAACLRTRGDRRAGRRRLLAAGPHLHPVPRRPALPRTSRS